VSRNLCQTECCGEEATLEEAPHPATVQELGAYWNEFKYLPFAKAHCAVCGAKYLAWFARWSGRWYATDHMTDLSYRSSFNDEPGDEDLPEYEVRTVTERRPVGGGEWERVRVK
jgi:hypothetical protein